MAAMKDEISERENVISQNYTTIQLLRKRLADLEKHKYVLGFRTQVRRATLVPPRGLWRLCFLRRGMQVDQPAMLRVQHAVLSRGPRSAAAADYYGKFAYRLAEAAVCIMAWELSGTLPPSVHRSWNRSWSPRMQSCACWGTSWLSKMQSWWKSSSAPA